MKWTLPQRPRWYPIEVGPLTPPEMAQEVYLRAARYILPIPSFVTTLELLLWDWLRPATREVPASTTSGFALWKDGRESDLREHAYRAYALGKRFLMDGQRVVVRDDPQG
jgi:hypothetical protein